MSKFNTKSNSSISSVDNLAGGKAFSLSAEEELLNAVLTSFLEDKFYEKGDDRLSRIKTLVGKCSPEFVAKLAYFARTQFHMRSTPIVLLGELAWQHGSYNGGRKSHEGYETNIIVRAISETITRADELTELTAYMLSTHGKLTKKVKRGLRHAVLKFDRYQLAKYKSSKKDVSLVDNFNLVHPKVKHANEEQKKAWKDLMDGNLSSFDTWETELSSNASTETWEKLIRENKLGYMAMIRNLNNFIKYEISEEAKGMVIKKLTDEKEVKNSKQLPFRFLTAFEQVNDSQYRDAIVDAMDIAVNNVPVFDGNTLIVIDTSGSMTWSRDKHSAIRIASIFGASLLKSNPRADVLLVDTKVVEYKGTTRNPIITIADDIVSKATGGGTEISLAFNWARNINKKYDRVVILSDNESWAERSYGSSVQDAYEAYKRAVDANPWVYAIDITGYGTRDLKGHRLIGLTGWSDKLFDFMKYAEQGQTLTNVVKNLEI